MIDDTLEKIEEKIRNSATIKEENRRELLRLLSSLKSEIENLSQEQGQHAQDIAGFAHASAHEATREDRSPEQLQESLKSLSSSTSGLEASHPTLVETINAICVALANLGV
jgi:DNA repair exonuclease SbcCD ATPase subunit